MVPIAIALIVYGIAFIWIEKRSKDVEPQVTNLAKMSYKTALLIGCFQVLVLYRVQVGLVQLFWAQLFLGQVVLLPRTLLSFWEFQRCSATVD